MSKRRRKSQGHSSASFQIESLEPRRLLAGMVNVSMAGQNLIVVGDQQANTVEVNLDADTAAEAVSSSNGTQINFLGRSAQFDMSRIRDLRIHTGGGDDTVVVQAESRQLRDDLIVTLGAGDDGFALLGGGVEGYTVRDDVRIYGHGGQDNILISQVAIRDDLRFYGGSGHDVLAVDQSMIGDRGFFAGHAGMDSLMLSQSWFGDDVSLYGGNDDDTVGLADVEFGDRLTIAGARGTDTLTMEDLDFNSRRYREFSMENQPTGEDAVAAHETALQPLKDWLFDVTASVDAATADQLQDATSDVLDAFGVSLVSLDLDPESQTVSVSDPTPSISVMWDQAVQQAVINTGPGPTIASRAYAMMHTAMFDAWSAYDDAAVSTQLEDTLQRPQSENTDTNKMQAMSFAAYRVLDDLFADQTAIFDDLMDQLGYDTSDASTDPTTPTGIGNHMAAALLDFRHQDGSNQLGDDPMGDGSPYSDVSGYMPVNPVGDPLLIDAWTPEFVPIDSDPGTEDRIQEFLTPHWGDVTPFGLNSGSEFRPVEPQPFLLVEATYDLDAGTITLADNTVLDIDPSLIGSVINPAFIEQTEEVIEYSANLTDEHKLIAEFWEDGGGTSFPPGTFMTFAQFVSARDNHSLDQDAQLFMAMGNAVFDAGVATWEAKSHYDYVRPVRAIRELGELGLIGEFDAELGGYAIDAWTPAGGTDRILATDFLTYQTPGSDPSPPFAEYTSGHSAFSAAGAEILALFTGSDVFGASVTFPEGSSRFEPGLTPMSDVTLSWETFSAAADEAGFSRLYGGIHFTEGDVNGRSLGRNVAGQVWTRVQGLINGNV